jgi:hypothetical protein
MINALAYKDNYLWAGLESGILWRCVHEDPPPWEGTHTAECAGRVVTLGLSHVRCRLRPGAVQVRWYCGKRLHGMA